MAILQTVVKRIKIFVFAGIAIIALACDAPNRSTERGAGSEIEERSPVDPAESDTSAVHADSTTSDGTSQRDSVR